MEKSGYYVPSKEIRKVLAKALQDKLLTQFQMRDLLADLLREEEYLDVNDSH